MRIFIIILSLFISSSAMVKDASAATKAEANAEDIQKIEKYLNGIETLVAPFSQEDSFSFSSRQHKQLLI